MRTLGVQARGIRLPIIGKGDDLPTIVTDCVINSAKAEGISFHDDDVIGITEAIVAKAQGNFATVDDVALDISQKFGDSDVGLVFPMLSRNRFLNILKGISKGSKKVIILLKYPADEVGNPLMNRDKFDEIEDMLHETPVSESKFKEIAGEFAHPFTGVDYVSLYKEAGDNIEIYFSDNACDILKLTKNVLVAEIHDRNRTKRKLQKAGAETVYTLSDVMSSPINDSGFNQDYGVLGSNLYKDDSLKLFPRDCTRFAFDVHQCLFERTGISFEVLVYGDGAFKDPQHGIWELADPVVSPGFTPKLAGMPNEIKLKYVVETQFSAQTASQKGDSVREFIAEQASKQASFSEGTTPRRYADLIGSLCDLMSGSGDKGTPVVLIQGYFDNYATE